MRNYPTHPFPLDVEISPIPLDGEKR